MPRRGRRTISGFKTINEARTEHALKPMIREEPVKTGLLAPTAADFIQQALWGLGFNTTESKSTMDTPARFVRYLQEFMQPFDPAEVLGVGFDGPKDGSIHGLVAQSHIPFRGVCEHHLLPMWGHAAIGYVPNERVVGLSKIARLVEGIGCSRPSLQELIGEKIADAFVEHLKAKGVIVVIDAEHSCMACRGVNKPDVVTHTSTIRGLFRDVPALREEFFAIISRKA